MIKSYWLRLLLFALAGAGIGLVVSLLSPKKYEAIMQIMIDQTYGPRPPGMSDAGNTVVDLKDFSRSRSISTQVEQLTSFGVIGDAAARAKEALGAPADDEELETANLQNSLTVAAESTSDMISVRVRLSDPERAKTVAQEIYRAFEDKLTSASKEAGSRATASVASMHASLKKQLNAVDAQVEALRNAGSSEPMTEIQAEVNGTAKLREAREGYAIALAGARQRVQSLAQELKGLKSTEFAAQTVGENPLINALQGQIATTETQKAVASLRYLPDHPIMVELDTTIQKLKDEVKQIKQANRKIEGTSTTVASPLRTQLVSALASARTDLSALQDQLAEADASIASRENRTQRWPRFQNEYQKLLREQVGLERKYTDATAELGALRALERGRTSPTLLITPATAIPEPVSPKHLINTMFGLIGGLILGVLSMLSTEGKRQPIRSLAHLNSLASQPVYRIIPELRMPFRGLNKPPAEPFETLLVNFRRSEKRPYRIGIVGITKDAGASITSLNVALAAEKHGNRAVIVETDEKSTIRRLLHRQGIGVEGQVSHVTPYVTLVTVDSLRQVQNADGSTGFGQEIQSLETDLTVVDFEPATESAEYAFAASNLDEMIVLVRAERTKSVEFLHAQQALAESGCPLVTVVFSRSSDLQLVTDAVESYASPKALSQ
ncbi:MAG: hypothetical protein WAO58_02295 [Fimbriimonadaceae bacterium]